MKKQFVATLFLVGIIFLLEQSLASKCGGNCYEGDCPVCLCGIEPNYVDLDKVCDMAKGGWDPVCCKCIANMNANNMFMKENWLGKNVTHVGVFGLATSDCLGDGGRPPCDVSSNFGCAYGEIYSEQGWNYWAPQCQFCTNEFGYPCCILNKKN